MPYKLVSKNGMYAVKTITTGKLHGWTTKQKAEAQLRLLQSIMKY
jgi:hypothetical protein